MLDFSIPWVSPICFSFPSFYRATGILYAILRLYICHCLWKKVSLITFWSVLISISKPSNSKSSRFVRKLTHAFIQAEFRKTAGLISLKCTVLFVFLNDVKPASSNCQKKFYLNFCLSEQENIEGFLWVQI